MTHRTQPTVVGEPAPPTRLVRQLGTFDAVIVGLGSMIGAGIYTALAPAAAAAGEALLVGLAIAAFIAWCNAKSSAALAALYPESGGTYVYGRKRLGPFWGYLAGWAFVIGKLASCAAMALTFADYVAPSFARALAAVAVAVVTLVNCRGVEKAAFATRLIVAFVLASLAVVVFAALASGGDEGLHPDAISGAGPYGILQAAGFLFFAFAGYARIATLGEEVKNPAQTIPRAIPWALGIALGVYALVAISALHAVGAAALARASAPLAVVVETSRWPWLTPIVRAGAAVASLGVLLSLLAGVSRTVFAMASNGDFPAFLARVHPRYRIPDAALLVVGSIVVVAVLAADIRHAIGFSSFAVLMYYAIANAAAMTLDVHEPAGPPQGRIPECEARTYSSARRGSRALAACGIGGCLLLAFSVPAGSLLGGCVLLALGAAAFFLRRERGAV